MIVSGLSGNEIYCLAQKGWLPGGIVVGNSVQSLGVLGSISSGLRSIAGGEISNLTQLITDGRHAALARLEAEARAQKADGVTGVASELKQLAGLHEFLAIGTAIHFEQTGQAFFTTACSGQDLFCQLDAGFHPIHFVMGNVVYAIGLGRGITSFLRGVAGGEVKEISQMYNHTRHLALQRLEDEARQFGANCVVDVQTTILPFGPGAREMLMIGTASNHPLFAGVDRPVTSELTGEELWNLAQMGYAPQRLLLGTSVYSLGFVQGIGAFFSALSRGEVNSVTQLIYEARANCLSHIHEEAVQIGADAVVGTKVHIYEMGGGFVEVLAVGTAVKKMPGIDTKSDVLPPQAIIRDRDTFFDKTHLMSPQKLERT